VSVSPIQFLALMYTYGFSGLLFSTKLRLSFMQTVSQKDAMFVDVFLFPHDIINMTNGKKKRVSLSRINGFVFDKNRFNEQISSGILFEG
jgi:hypothetical protein